jgi:hypothetical protein
MKCYELGWFGFFNFKNFFWWKILQKWIIKSSASLQKFQNITKSFLDPFYDGGALVQLSHWFWSASTSVIYAWALIVINRYILHETNQYRNSKPVSHKAKRTENKINFLSRKDWTWSAAKILPLATPPTSTIRENMNGAGALHAPSHFLSFYFLYLSNYIIFRLYFFASHSKITNRMEET